MMITYLFDTLRSDFKIAIPVNNICVFSMEDLLDKSIDVMNKHGSMFRLSVLVIEKNAALSLLDERTIDIVDIRLHDLLYLYDP